MRPLHLLYTKASAQLINDVSSYIQIKSGRVNVAGFAVKGGITSLVSLPVEDVFGDVFTADEEFYIRFEHFKDAKAFSAIEFTREGDTVTPIFKDGKKGFPMDLISPCDVTYPDINKVIPTKRVALEKIGFNPLAVVAVQKILQATSVCMYFSGQNSACIIKDVEASNKGFGVMLPAFLPEEEQEVDKETEEEASQEEEFDNLNTTPEEEEDDLLG